MSYYYTMADFSRPKGAKDKKKRRRKLSDIMRGRLLQNAAIATGITAPISLAIDRYRVKHQYKDINGLPLNSLKQNYENAKSRYASDITKHNLKPGNPNYENMQARLSKLREPIKEINLKRLKSHAGVLGAGILGGTLLVGAIRNRGEKSPKDIMNERRKQTLARKKSNAY